MKTLLIATIIAMSASLASAECAWVLWNQHAGSSSLQRRILAWPDQEERLTRGTMAAEHHALVQAMGVNRDNLSTSMKGLECKGLIRVQRTLEGKAEAIVLTSRGRTQAEVVKKERIGLCPR
jgi:DNA-binding MarR family transcriptional regulator